MQVRNVLVILGIFGLGVGAGIVIESYSTSNETVSKVLSTTDAESVGLSVSTNNRINTDSMPFLTGSVSKIIDGDTFVLASGETVRLIGIDAPEKSDCYSLESTNELFNLIKEKTIKLEKDVSETDRYQRLLRYVWADSSTSSEQVIFVNDLLVREGFVEAYNYPPDSKYKEQLAQAEIEAKENKHGLWGECSTNDKPGLGSSEDKDCKNFKTHAEAQAFFDSQGPGDPHKLDSDGDGVACESLP